MAKKLSLVNGVPRMLEEAGAVEIYDETYNVTSTISTGTPVTLPNSGTYDGAELEVRLNGQRLDAGIDYSYVGVAPDRTQVAFTFNLVNGDNINFRVDRAL